MRRRGHMRLTYNSTFDLAAEIEAVCKPLAVQVTALPIPAMARGQVREIVAASHHVVSVIAVWVGVDHRPALPPVDDDDLAGGGWAALLAMMARPYNAALSDLLRRAYPPDAFDLRGNPSRSERLERLLRETLDRKALALHRYLDRCAAMEGKAS